MPNWAILGSDVFAEFLVRNGISGELSRLLGTVREENAADVAARVRRLITQAPSDAAVSELVRRAYAHVGAERVAVRSSGAEEDGAVHSFAGQFATFLGAGADDVECRVRDCWASAYGERALTYRLGRGLALGETGMAVIVQEMVAAERSGVVFTADPATRDGTELVIGAGFGLGEGLVSGMVDADTISVTRWTGEIVDYRVGDKSEEYVLTDSGSARVAVAAEKRGARVLTDEEIRELTSAGRELEKIFGGPQDVEFAYENGRVRILQSRPITSGAKKSAVQPDVLIWDNSNIIESYSDVTSEMTFSFARYVYHRVYRSYLTLLNTPHAEIREMDEWLPNMLGFFHGRVYYNLLNWYRVLRLLPFYRMNRSVFEVSLGVSENLDEGTANSLSPFSAFGTLRGRRIRVVVGATFLMKFLRSRRIARRFTAHFQRVFSGLEQRSYEGRSADEVYRAFRWMERALLDRWGAMMLLETVIGLSFGVLYGLTKRWIPDAPEWLFWSVANPGEAAASVEPARRMVELAELAREDAGIERIVTTSVPAAVPAALAAAGKEGFLREVGSYIRAFGYRSLNELKLEEPDLREDPAAFYAMLRDTLRTTAARSATRGSGDPDQVLRERLGPLRRRAYEVVRRKVRHGLEDREHVRFCRTRAFGLVRRMLLAMGDELARMGAIESAADVFHLRLDELRGCMEGTVAHEQLKPAIRLRKEARERQVRLTAPARFTTRGPVYWRGNLESAGWNDGARGPTEGAPSILRGIPSGPGTAEGVASVVTEPRDVGGAVLVTYRTDPGWVGVLPSVRALLIERGSPLTHVAIVARELGVPTVVQIPNLTRDLRDGAHVHVNGDTGEVRVRADAPRPAD